MKDRIKKFVQEHGEDVIVTASFAVIIASSAYAGMFITKARCNAEWAIERGEWLDPDNKHLRLYHKNGWITDFPVIQEQKG